MSKLNKLGYTKVEVLVIVVLLGIVAFITINKTSYAFAVDGEDAVVEVVHLIERQAEEYALDNLGIFEEAKTTFISVSDLIDNEYLLTDDKGLITDPSDINKNFNDKKIKLEYDEEKNQVKATLVD